MVDDGGGSHAATRYGGVRVPPTVYVRRLRENVRLGQRSGRSQESARRSRRIVGCQRENAHAADAYRRDRTP